MYKILLRLGKVALSGCLALAVLTGLCFFYYNIPMHYTSADGATDYKWLTNHFYSRGTEGFAWGKTNNEGYLNTFDYQPGMPVSVLVMGSSHMEAYQVAMEESTASRLNAALTGKTVYNIGTSGHTLMTCVGNLKAAVGKYLPQDYIIIETAASSFPNESLTLALNNRFPEHQSHEGGIIGLLQRVPYLRLLYKQLRGLWEVPAEEEMDAVPVSLAASVSQNDPALLDQLCKKILADASTGGGGQTILLSSSYTIPL